MSERGLRQSLCGLVPALQAHLARQVVRFIGERIFGFQIEVSGLGQVPAGEPLIVAGGPHRSWVDGFLVLLAMPATPRVRFLASEHVADRWWKRVLLWLAGSTEPVSTRSALNREALEAALRVLEHGERLGVFPEGWDHLDGPTREVRPLRRGLAFIAQQSGRRVVPVAVSGGRPLWRGKTLRVQLGSPLDPPPRDATKWEQQIWSDRLQTVLQGSLPPEPPEIPLSTRRWPWLTTLFN